MFLHKAGAYPRVEQLKCTSLGYASCLSCKHWTWLESPALYKHSSLLQKFIKLWPKKSFITFDENFTILSPPEILNWANNNMTLKGNSVVVLDMPTEEICKNTSKFGQKTALFTKVNFNFKTIFNQS
jgi:hypothetical protein